MMWFFYDTEVGVIGDANFSLFLAEMLQYHLNVLQKRQTTVYFLKRNIPYHFEMAVLAQSPLDKIQPVFRGTFVARTWLKRPS